jgi:hypothetical protein
MNKVIYCACFGLNHSSQVAGISTAELCTAAAASAMLLSVEKRGICSFFNPVLCTQTKQVVNHTSSYSIGHFIELIFNES